MHVRMDRHSGGDGKKKRGHDQGLASLKMSWKILRSWAARSSCRQSSPDLTMTCRRAQVGRCPKGLRRRILRILSSNASPKTRRAASRRRSLSFSWPSSDRPPVAEPEWQPASGPVSAA